MRKKAEASPVARSNVTSIRPRCEDVSLELLKPAARKLRSHSRAKLATLERSMSKKSQLDPITINAANVIVDGHARVEVARRLGWSTITAVRVEHLTDEDLRLYAIAANKLAEDVQWDADALRLELEEIEASLPQIDLTLSGYSVPQIDSMRGAYRASEYNDLDDVPQPTAKEEAVTEPGDIWELGPHRLICGDATEVAVLEALMGGEEAGLMFTDPPYNVRINGHVSGTAKHAEFSMGSGEMSKAEFEQFLRRSLSAAHSRLTDGALAYVCMDHAHVDSLCAVAAELFTERKNICVWDKGVGGMGSMYRSRHELIAVFKKGQARHINNVELGRHGRDRTNVWNYPGVTTMGKGKTAALSLHPTVKPVALVADAILDASCRNAIVLDPFGGSGTTLIAAEKTHRQARLVEIAPHYVDVIIRRFEAATGGLATLHATGKTFSETRRDRLQRVASSPASTEGGPDGK